MTGIDGSPRLIAAATALSPELELRVADAAALPLADASMDLVVAFMSLHDVDDLDGAVREIARVLEPGGRFCMAIVHPINSAGRFEENGRFVIAKTYLGELHVRRPRRAQRSGDDLREPAIDRSPTFFALAARARAGLVTETLREPSSPDPAGCWDRVPLFLHLRAVKRGATSPAT